MIDFAGDLIFQVIQARNDLTKRLENSKVDGYSEKDNSKETSSEEQNYDLSEELSEDSAKEHFIDFDENGFAYQMTRSDVYDKTRQYLQRMGVTQSVRSVSFNLMNLNADLINTLKSFGGLRTSGLSSAMGEKNKETMKEVSEIFKDLEELSKLPPVPKERREQTKAEKDLEDEAEEKRKRLNADLKSRVQAIYQKILIYAFLVNDEKSDITNFTIKKLLKDSQSSKEKRITALNLGLDLNAVRGLLETNVFPIDSDNFMRNMIAAKRDIKNPWKKQKFVFEGLGEVTENEVFTPDNAADMLVNNLGLTDKKWIKTVENLSPRGFIDPGCKTGAIFIAILRRFKKALKKRKISKEKSSELLQKLGNSFYAVPTSAVTYEIIKKVFKDYNWPIEHILFKPDLTQFHQNWAYNVAQAVLGDTKK